MWTRVAAHAHDMTDRSMCARRDARARHTCAQSVWKAGKPRGVFNRHHSRTRLHPPPCVPAPAHAQHPQSGLPPHTLPLSSASAAWACSTASCSSSSSLTAGGGGRGAASDPGSSSSSGGGDDGSGAERSRLVGTKPTVSSLSRRTLDQPSPRSSMRKTISLADSKMAPDTPSCPGHALIAWHRSSAGGALAL